MGAYVTLTGKRVQLSCAMRGVVPMWKGVQKGFLLGRHYSKGKKQDMGYHYTSLSASLSRVHVRAVDDTVTRLNSGLHTLVLPWRNHSSWPYSSLENSSTQLKYSGKHLLQTLISLWLSSFCCRIDVDNAVLISHCLKTGRDPCLGSFLLLTFSLSLTSVIPFLELPACSLGCDWCDFPSDCLQNSLKILSDFNRPFSFLHLFFCHLIQPLPDRSGALLTTAVFNG